MTLMIILLFLWGSVIGQKSAGGVPLSFGNKTQIDGSSFSANKTGVPVVLDNEEQRKKFSNEEAAFGAVVNVNIDVKRDGKENKIDKGTVWLLEIGSKGAHGLAIGLNKFRIPDGANLFVFNKDKSMKLGAYTVLNWHESNRFMVQPIKGDTLVIEYFEPTKAAFEGDLQIDKVVHVFEPIFGDK